MKSDVVFTLEKAGWPALLVDPAAKVVRANAAAIKTFSAALEASHSNLSAIWTAEGVESPENFLAHWEHSPLPAALLKFRLQDGTSGAFLTSICPVTQDGQKLFLLQLLPDAGASDSNLAHKQKLDCALQLARSVSLDFNNALTSILGHTSLLLAKVESNNP